MSFADAIDIISGGTPKTTVPDYWNGDIPWLSVADFNNGYRWVSSAEKHITELGLYESATALLDRGDIIISARGTVGVLAQLARPMAFNQSCYGIRGKAGIAENDFLYYALRQAVTHMKQMAHGGVFDTITRDTFKILRVYLPPLPEQRAIAHILGTLDDKIELNRRMSETLERMAQALFKSWFVDFDPVVVNALRAGNPLPEKFAKRAAHYRENPDALGLPDPILRLFPARFVDSELGEIPEGWEVAIMGNQFRIVMGQSPPGSTYNESRKGSPFYQGRVDFSYRFPQQRVFCTAPTRFAQDGDTLVSVRAPVGSVNMAVERCAIGRGVAAVRYLTGSRSYTYYFVRSLKKIFENFEAEGTVFGAINKDGFNSIKCVVPPIRLVERFDALCKPLDDKIERNERESRTLAALRDTLLPRLISGQLRVKDAERFLKERGL